MEGARSKFSIAVLKEIIHACGVEWLHIVPTNHAAHDTVKVRRQAIEDQLDFGGGTDMPVGINASYNLKPDLVITVTDGETGWRNVKRTDVPVAVAIINGDEDSYRQVPHWMKLIPIIIPEDFK
jgi:hypothetical protein